MKYSIKERCAHAHPLFYTVSMILVLSCTSVFKELESNMIVLSSGEFIMGCDSSYADPDEYPAHVIAVDSFKLCRFEVTQKLWKAVMKRTPSYNRGANNPVEAISYYDVEKFLVELNKRTGRNYRLPTEIEWEYAASLGTRNCCIDEIAWHGLNSDGKSHPVGTKHADSLGFYDLIGNVNEWVSGSYDGTNYNGDIVIKVDPLREETIFRGGAFNAELKFCRVSNRNHVRADTRNYAIGLRLAESIGGD